jgi:hypothetical protein
VAPELVAASGAVPQPARPFAIPMHRYACTWAGPVVRKSFVTHGGVHIGLGCQVPVRTRVGARRRADAGIESGDRSGAEGGQPAADGARPIGRGTGRFSSPGRHRSTSRTIRSRSSTSMGWRGAGSTSSHRTYSLTNRRPDSPAPPSSGPTIRRNRRLPGDRPDGAAPTRSARRPCAGGTRSPARLVGLSTVIEKWLWHGLGGHRGSMSVGEEDP